MVREDSTGSLHGWDRREDSQRKLYPVVQNKIQERGKRSRLIWSRSRDGRHSTDSPWEAHGPCCRNVLLNGIRILDRPNLSQKSPLKLTLWILQSSHVSLSPNLSVLYFCHTSPTLRGLGTLSSFILLILRTSHLPLLFFFQLYFHRFSSSTYFSSRP